MRLRKRFLLTAVGATVAGMGLSSNAVGQSAFEPLPPVPIGSIPSATAQPAPLSPPVTITPVSVTAGTAAPATASPMPSVSTDIAPTPPKPLTVSTSATPSAATPPSLTPSATTGSPVTSTDVPVVPTQPVAGSGLETPLPVTLDAGTAGQIRAITSGPAPVSPSAASNTASQPVFVPAATPTPTGLVPLIVTHSKPGEATTPAIPLQPLQTKPAQVVSTTVTSAAPAAPTVPAASTAQPASTLTPALAPVATITTTPATAPTNSTTTLYPVANGSAGVSSQPSLVVKQVLPDQIVPGQSIVADVTVTNTGGRTAEAVLITGWWTSSYDLSQESVASQQVNGKRTWGMGSIAAGETRTVRLKLTPTSNTPSATEFRSGFDASFSSAVTDTRYVKVLKPELGLTIAASESSMIGQPMIIQVKVKNSSPVPVSNVNVVVRLPDNLRHASGKADLETDVPTLSAGATETIPLEVVPTKPGECRTRVRISAVNCDSLDQELRVMAIEPKVAVNLHGPKVLYQNWPATYEAVIENQGDQPLKMVGLEVKLPQGFRDLRASDKPMYDAAGHRLVWNIPALKPGEKRTIVWFGLAKQSEDLMTTGTVSVGSLSIRRAEWSTKNAGTETK